MIEHLTRHTQASLVLRHCGLVTRRPTRQGEARDDAESAVDTKTPTDTASEIETRPCCLPLNGSGRPDRQLWRSPVRSAQPSTKLSHSLADNQPIRDHGASNNGAAELGSPKRFPLGVCVSAAQEPAFSLWNSQAIGRWKSWKHTSGIAALRSHIVGRIST